MAQRVITGVVAAALLIGVLAIQLFVGGYVLQLAIYALYLLALHEMISAFHTKGMHSVRWAVFLSGALLMPAYLWKGTNAMMAALFLGAFLCLIASIFQRNPKEGDFLATCFPLIYPTIPFLAMFLLSTMPARHFLPAFISIFISSIASDVFALLIGVKFGRHKLIPSVSPKKTWEGAVGGLLGSVFFTFLYGLFLNLVMGYDFTLGHFIGLGVIGSIATQLGDLIASVIKRYCGVKDFGKIFPGHGGVLDRLDGMLLNSLMMYVYMTILMGGLK